MSNGNLAKRKHSATNSSHIQREAPFKQAKLDVCFELPDYLSSATALIPTVTKTNSPADAPASFIKPSEFAQYDGKDMGKGSGKAAKTSIVQANTDILRIFRRDLLKAHKDDEIYIHMFNERKKALQGRKHWGGSSLSEKKEILLKIDCDVKTEMASKDFVLPESLRANLKDDGHVFLILGGKHNLVNVGIENLKTFEPVVIAEAYRRRTESIRDAEHTWAIQSTGNAARNLKPDLTFLKEKRVPKPGNSALRIVMNRETSLAVGNPSWQDLPTRELLNRAGNIVVQNPVQCATIVSTGDKAKIEGPVSEDAVDSRGDFDITTNESAPLPPIDTDIRMKDLADASEAPLVCPEKPSAKIKSRVFILVASLRKGAVPISLRRLNRDSHYKAFYKIVEQQLKLSNETARVAPKKIFVHVARSIERAAFASAKDKADYLDKMMRVEKMLSADPGAIVVQKFDKKFPEGHVYCCKKMRDTLKAKNE